MLPKDKGAGEEGLPERTNHVDGEIDSDEIGELMQPAAELIAQVDWSRGPKVLARSLAVRLFLEKHVKEIVALSDAILDQALKKLR